MAAKFVAVCAVVTSALAEAHYGYGGYGAGYGHGVGYGRGVAGHPYGASSYTYRSPQGIGKRSADAEPEADAEAHGYGYPAHGYGYRSYGYGPGVASHYGGGSSYVARSPQGIGKRSADAEADAFYGYAGYSPRVYGYGPGIAAHYGGGSSYVARSPQGLRGKRDADADADAYYGYGFPSYGHGSYYGYGGARSYEYRSPQGLRGKRDADADADAYYGYGPSSRSYQQVTRSNGYYADPSSYRVETNGYSAGVYQNNFNGFNRGKRSAEADAEAYYGYGPSSRSYQQVTRSNGYHADPSSYRVETNGYSAGVYQNNFNGFNRGKRSADADADAYYGYGPSSSSYQNVNRYNHGSTNSYSVATNGYAGQVRENNIGYGGAYGYGFVNGK